MILKEFYVIVNNNGEFFHIDRRSGGYYPCFIDNYTSAEKYNTKEDADEFLNLHYHKLFEKEFKNVSIKKITVIMEDI